MTPNCVEPASRFLAPKGSRLLPVVTRPTSPWSGATLLCWISITTVNQVLQWLQGMFTDSCFHLGGDEVVTSCWKNDSAIAQWATAHNVSYPGLLTLFLGKVQQQVMASGRVPIHWQEAFENAFPPTAASAAVSSTSAPAPVSAVSGTAVGASSALANSTIIQVPYRTQRKPSGCTADCWVFVGVL